MPAGLLLLVALVFGFALRADTTAPIGPSYTGASIVNAADNQPGPLAPNTIATIYGTGLSYVTRSVTASDLHTGQLPTVLPGTGVRVSVAGIGAGIYYVSPTQINFLVPSILLPGAIKLQVALDGMAGPPITVQIAGGAPAFFQLDAQTVIATHPDGSVITPDNPASAGDQLVFYATGLGQVIPPLADREVPTKALSIKQLSDLQVMVDGVALDPGQIKYAGVSPGFAGLYQINLQLPGSVGVNPEIRVKLVDFASPAGLRLWVRP